MSVLEDHVARLGASAMLAGIAIGSVRFAPGRAIAAVASASVNPVAAARL